MMDYPEIGYTPANLRHWIELHGLRQKDVAIILCVNERTVRMWLADRSQTEKYSDMPFDKWRKLLAWQPENPKS